MNVWRTAGSTRELYRILLKEPGTWYLVGSPVYDKPTDEVWEPGQPCKGRDEHVHLHVGQLLSGQQRCARTRLWLEIEHCNLTIVANDSPDTVFKDEMKI